MTRINVSYEKGGGAEARETQFPKWGTTEGKEFDRDGSEPSTMLENGKKRKDQSIPEQLTHEGPKHR